MAGLIISAITMRQQRFRAGCLIPVSRILLQSDLQSNGIIRRVGNRGRSISWSERSDAICSQLAPWRAMPSARPGKSPVPRLAPGSRLQCPDAGAAPAVRHSPAGQPPTSGKAWRQPRLQISTSFGASFSLPLFIAIPTAASIASEPPRVEKRATLNWPPSRGKAKPISFPPSIMSK